MLRDILIWICLVVSVSSCVSANWKSPDDYYQYIGSEAPEDRTVIVCSAYSCQQQTKFTFSDTDLKAVESMLGRASTATEEREAIAHAIGYLEGVVGLKVGTSDDRGQLFPDGSGDPGQLDCIDETANTTSYLLVLERESLLRFHSVRKPALRGAIIDGRWPHFSAVLTEKTSGLHFAVDSWPRYNGEPALLFPLDEWLRQRSRPA